MTRTIALASAVGLFGIWTLATYLLEGRIRTFLRPDAVFTRFSYTIIVNVAIGVGGSVLLIMQLLRAVEVPRLSLYGLTDPKRILLMAVNSTIIFHNAFALRGVTEALADADKLEVYEQPQLPLIGTALLAMLVLIVLDITLLRPTLDSVMS